MWSAIRAPGVASFTNAFTQHLNGFGAILGVLNGEPEAVAIDPSLPPGPPPAGGPSNRGCLWLSLWKLRWFVRSLQQRSVRSCTGEHDGAPHQG